MEKQTYKYIVKESILYGCKDEYELNEQEFKLLYSFYVTYSMCGSQSWKKKDFSDYGWNSGVDGAKVSTEKKINNALKSVLKIERNDKTFVFTEENNLKETFSDNNLNDGLLNEYNTERFVIGKTKGSNKYLKLFYRIRDGLAHGKFALVFSEDKEKMILIQDDDRDNVTARIVLKLSTVMRFANIVMNGPGVKAEVCD